MRTLVLAALCIGGCSEVPNAVVGADERITQPPAHHPVDRPDRTWVGVVVAQTIDFPAEVSGIVRVIDKPLGSIAAEGEVLVTLEQPGLNAEIEVAQALLGAAKARLARAQVEVSERRRVLDGEQKLLLSGAIPSGLVEDAKGDVERAKADRKIAGALVAEARARARLLDDRRARLEVHAPEEIQISAVLTRPGSFVDPGALLLRAIRGEALRIRFAVSPDAGAELHAGVPVVVRSESDGEVAATVKHISPVVDPESGLIAVEAALARGDLRPGGVVRVWIADPQTPTKDAY